MRISAYQLDKPDRRNVLVFYSYPTITCDEAMDVKSSLLLYDFVFAWWRGRDQASQPKLPLCKGLHININMMSILLY